ncbi:hypothetical protein LEP1GSC127_1720 [Leptospira kirschneri str. 200801925]|uniref:Uncharacterized protein n=1 Tax=Leptospira kirschneri str. 200802841 TaxID=1193047 RepID=A0A828XXR3_9LEPT|nr:hypothetical protein LEP1GSC044_3685 [Leptospira kirschneri serovar Grippotyphosa str. RM52]EKO52023.1 hypothetical protein LEP1GSC131_3488 [Leptospira kirschneri str. 200802841]EMK05631.1 hypothetical protein LEP1GSC176_2227 [Leptospira kirschneri str. MMD1493]EMO75649.1 hypothetical protein LEP1GSC127_1720 [Leptospira kirschneri str. 200801925]
MGTLTIVDLQLNFENCGNYYKIQKESSLSNLIFAQNHYFTTISKI